MHFRTIKTKIFFVLSCFMLALLLLIMATIYRSTFELLKKNEMNYNVAATSRTKENFEYTLDMIAKIGRLLASDAQIVDALEQVNPTEDEQTAIKNTISNTLLSYIYTQQYVKGIHIVGTRKWQVFSNILSIDQDTLRQRYGQYLAQKQERPLREWMTGRQRIMYYPDINMEVISYHVPLYNIDTRRIIGLIIMDIDYTIMEQMFTVASMQSGEKALIVASDGEIIFNYPYNVIFDSVVKDHAELLKADSTQLTSKVYGRESLLVSDSITHTDWKIIRIMSLDKLTEDTQLIKRQTGYLSLCFIVLCIVLSIIISRWLTRPITQLHAAFKRVGSGDLEARVSINTHDELGDLGKQFNKMAGRLQDNLTRELAQQRYRSDLEFAVLQAQINPHFLYNTLDSIKWLAVLQGVDNIADMTTSLINLLKYNLSKDGPNVTLSGEIESVRNYAKIQKFRYGDIFRLKVDAAEDTLDCSVLRFLLQPLVENSILHGFSNTEENGEILIWARIEEGKLHVRVEDNGSGIDIEQAEEIFKQKDKDRFSHIGINNINERIKMTYGSEFGLYYKLNRERGTVAEIVLPASKMPAVQA